MNNDDEHKESFKKSLTYQALDSVISALIILAYIYIISWLF